VPLNFALVAPVKFVPVIVTLVPAAPLVGEKLVIVGAAVFTVKSAEEVAVPAGVTIVIFPVTAFAGTVSVALVSLATEKVATATPPTATEVAPVNFVPVTVTEVPGVPFVGVKLVIVAPAGGGVVLPLTDPLQPIIANPPSANAHAAARLLPINGLFRLNFARQARNGIASHPLGVELD
jgi:hypothetical protein